MREITARQITDAVADLYIRANRAVSPDVESALRAAMRLERDPLAKQILQTCLDNLDAARETGLPVCQDTGMAVIWADIGQDVRILGGFEMAVNAGVAKACADGYLRASVVSDPLRRVNTGDNTPAILHTRLVPGDKVSLTVAPKGFGSENMSGLKLFAPTATRAEITAYIVDTVRQAGSNPCPPVVVGVGLGGDAELACRLAKEAFVFRALDCPHPDPTYADWERDTLAAVNALGIGPQGMGGDTTALGVHLAAAPTHIAGLPVAVNISCHVLRHENLKF